MVRTRVLIAGLAVALVSLSLVRADEEPKPAQQPPRTGGFQRPGGGGGGLASLNQPLVSTELAEKLALTKDQKVKIAKLTKEYESKNKAEIAKATEMLEKLRENRGDGSGLREVMEVVSKVRQERQDALAKVKDVLTDDQKKIFDEANPVRRPFGGGFGGPGGGGGFGGPGGGGFGRTGRTATGTPGVILPKTAQDSLKLTEEQKRKIEQMQKDIDAQLDKVLTVEQRRQLEEMKRATQNTSPFGGFGGGRGGRGGPDGQPGQGGPGGGRGGRGGDRGGDRGGRPARPPIDQN